MKATFFGKIEKFFRKWSRKQKETHKTNVSKIE